jgi:hypothetical protein
MEPGEGKRSFTDRSGAAGKAWLTCNTPYPANLCRLHCLVEFASRGEEAIASLAEVEMSEHQAEFFYDITMFGMLIDFLPHPGRDFALSGSFNVSGRKSQRIHFVNFSTTTNPATNSKLTRKLPSYRA